MWIKFDGGLPRPGIQYHLVETEQFLKFEQLEAQLALHRWIPVGERLPEETGDVLILCEGKIYQVEATVGEGTWEDKAGKEYQRTDVWCYDMVGYGDTLLGEDAWITHWKPILLPQGG